MNLKNELKNFGLFMITPVPAKFHFEGVDNKRVAKQLFVVTAIAQVVVLTAVAAGPEIVEKTRELKTRALDRFKK